MDSKHSRWPASTAHRWINCSGSLNAIDSLPVALREGRSSTFAEQGTAAHLIADTCLKNDQDAQEYFGKWIRVSGQGEFILDEEPEEDDKDGTYECDDEMVQGVQLYLDTVRGDVTKGATLTTEETADLEWLHPGMFGRRDAKVSEPYGLLRVYDFKYGRGVGVFVEQNEQEMYYALPDVRTGDYTKVELVIVQPRHVMDGDDPPGVRRWSLVPQKLMGWANNTLLPAVEATKPKDAPRTPGSWCNWCQFGDAGQCPEKNKMIEDAAGQDFADDAEEAITTGTKFEPKVPTNINELRRQYLMAEMLDAHNKAIAKAVDTILRSGGELDFAKLVRKKSNRIYDCEEKTVVKTVIAAAKKLKARLTRGDLFTPPKILSPAQMEKLLPKGALKPTIEGLTTKPDTGLTVVGMDDDRPAVISDPATDFKDD